MDLQIPLPIRLAASVSFVETTATPETPETRPSADQAAASRPAQSSGAGDTSYGSIPLSPGLRVQAAPGQSNHQFWLKDAKIAEELFTIHRSAQDLMNFASSMIGTQEASSSYRPIPVMSDGDVIFMTQLSEDIVRSVNGITSIRQHGTRMRKRKIRHGHPAPPPLPPREYSAHRSVGSRENTAAAVRTSRGSITGSGGGSRRLRKSLEDDQLQQCYKCGRKETPEWRKGPDGLLCNSCGLVYMKQRRKQKMAERAEKGERAGK